MGINKVKGSFSDPLLPYIRGHGNRRQSWWESRGGGENRKTSGRNGTGTPRGVSNISLLLKITLHKKSCSFKSPKSDRKMAFILRSAKCMINQERWDKEKLQAKQNRKSVCSINNTSLVPQGLRKQPRKFHRVIIMSSVGENNLLSLGVCNP